MLSRPELITKAMWMSIVMGIAEAMSLFLLVPAITALSTQENVWGLSIQAWVYCAIVLGVCSGVFGYFQFRHGYDTAMDMVKNIHRKLGDQIAKLPLGWFHQAKAGQISRMVSSELLMVGEVIAHLFSPMISRITVTVVIMVLTLIWDYRLGLILVVSTPIYLLFLSASGALSRKGKNIAEPRERELSDRIVEFTHNQATLRSCGLSTHYPPLVQANKQWRKAKSKELWFEIAGNIVGGVLTQIVVISLIIVAARLAITGSLDPLVTVAYIGLALRYAQVLMALTEASVGLETRRPLLEAINEILDACPLPEPVNSVPMPTPGTVELVDVCFGYQPDKPVLRNVSFTAGAHQMVALVGPSGCGKTTVARLISRFYEVDSGCVKVGGVDVRELTSSDLMRQLSMVFQDVYLFDDTLRNNIMIGNPQATEDEIYEAARLAGVSEIVARLPQGWNTPVGEGGKSLSGGERQRVAIARALLKQAPIVLLDEATSALDPENEANVVAAVDKLREHATIIVIAHKLHTIAQADLIVSLSAEGTVEDVGTHEDLFSRGGTYRSFWDKRSQAQGWRLT
ncbi:ABC transporter ATP-binding protein [Corynebacterium felinum]|uniref:ATP-binding cassette subfamily B protein n=2 Tax=Corynebacterium felinum TaxID=131318 RepID=A0ABU2B7G6_9CORY|nr:ABC transporter ATP-binding protein [Corynebacterium felinum]MDF5819631.1 ABC transporter ATP-binding protein [Corynebacterium felinum]MDR7354236.1 ATP-binding cassette subfamily B protein [Corynebacterium felinum]